jgi:putative SOS response-associated peptidase YedK
LINARAETVLEKPAFKNAMKRRRCLVPADGYYEWQSPGKIKQPYFIYPRDRQPIGFAGLMETWLGPNGEELDTVAIVTTVASTDLAVLHHRVPVTIVSSDFDRWLDCGHIDAEEAATLLTAPGEGVFAWHAVSTRVNRVTNDDPQLILPISEAEIAAENEKSQAKPARKSAPPKQAPTDDGQGSLF